MDNVEPINYTGNSDKAKQNQPAQERPKLEKVITGEVVIPKKSVGRKLREYFVEEALKSVVNHVIWDVVIPGVKGTLAEFFHESVDRTLFGERVARRQFRGINRSEGMMSRFTYNHPVNRDSRDPISRSAPQRGIGPERVDPDTFIFSSSEDARDVLEQLTEQIDRYGIVTLADLKDAAGLQTDFPDQKWGWDALGGAKILQSRHGYLLDLPRAQPIN